MFELDIQLGRDRLVVSHYLPVLRRRGWLENDNWKVRRSATLDQDPLVLQVVARIPKGCRVLLDLKETEPRRRAELNRRLAAELTDRTRFVVSTSNVQDLDQLREAGFATWRTLGGRRDLTRLLAAGDVQDEAVSVRQRLLDGATVRRLHDVAPSVVAWTVNGVGRACELRSAGVDGLTTDSTSVLVRSRI